MNEFLIRNASRRIDEINRKYRKQFIDPVSGEKFWSIHYQKLLLSNGLYAIYDDPGNQGYLYGKPL